jgi:hypothetical protein
VDFLVPGLLGMNVMGTGMWGIGFSLVVARNGNLLKRLIAAPVRRSHLLGAQIGARLLFLIPEAGALLLFAHFVLGVPLRGSVLLLTGVSLLGALAFSGLGLLTAARPRTIEGVSGLMNMVMVPMWIFSGIFFSTERFPAAARLRPAPARAGPARSVGGGQLRDRAEGVSVAVDARPDRSVTGPVPSPVHSLTGAVPSPAPFRSNRNGTEPVTGRNPNGVGAGTGAAHR